MRPSQYLAGALAGIAVVFGYAGQIGDNLVYLAERDLEKERKKQMADNKIQQAATETLDTELTDVQTEVHDLVPLISNLIADDASQKSRGDALQAAIDALKATAPDDTARIAILEDLKANLTPLLTALTPAPPVVPEPPVTPTPESPAVPAALPTTSALPAADGSAPAGSDAAAQANAATPVAAEA